MLNRNEKIRAARRDYARRYRREHPERVKAAQERYWLRKAQELEQRSKDDKTA